MENSPPSRSNSIELLAKFDTTVIAGLVFLALGGGIISFYYAHIRYLPDIEWSTSIVHLATATLIGGGLAILLALSLFLPGCIWSAFLLRDEVLMRSFCFHEQTDEICLRTLLVNIGLPFGAVVFANHLVLVAVEDRWQDSLLYIYGVTSAILLIPIAFWIKYNLNELLKKELLKTSPPMLTDDEKDRRLFKYIAWFLISILVSQFSMLLIYLFSGRPTGSAFWLTTIFCGLGVLISNHFIAIHIHRNRVQTVLVGLVIAALTLFVIDRNSVLSVQVLAFFGLGERSESVDLVLNDEGKVAKEKLEKSGLQERCAAKSDDRICNVRVLSRLGNEYLLKAADINPANDKIFTLQKSAVISRISRPPKKKNQTPPSGDPSSPATAGSSH